SARRRARVAGRRSARVAAMPSWRHPSILALRTTAPAHACCAVAARAAGHDRNEGLLDAREQPHELRALLRGEIREHILDRRLGDAPDAPVHALGFPCEMDALDAPIAAVRAALHPAVRLEPVDHAAGARALH